MLYITGLQVIFKKYVVSSRVVQFIFRQMPKKYYLQSEEAFFAKYPLYILSWKKYDILIAFDILTVVPSLVKARDFMGLSDDSF